MKNFLISLLMLFGLLTPAAPVAKLGSDTITALNPWKIVGTAITPRTNTNTLQVPSLGGAGTKCLHTDNSGNVSTSTADCGTGSGGSATTTINGVNGPTFTLTATSSGNSLSWSGEQLTIPKNVGFFTNDAGYLATTTGNWIGTFDGQEGTYYLARANHTGTQTASTISDFSSTARGLFSATTPLAYNSGTGLFSMPTSTDSVSGFLSAADHTTFNAKGVVNSVGGLATTTIAFATSSDTNLALNIVCATATCTFAPGWTGQLSVARGGTAASTFTKGLVAASGTTAFSSIASAAKGDLLVGSSTATYGWIPLGVGSTGKVLTASSTAPNGVSWETAASGGGGGSPASPSASVQFNDGGTFGGDADFAWDKTNDILRVGTGGTVTASAGSKAIVFGASSDGLGQSAITVFDQATADTKGDDISIYAGLGKGTGVGGNLYLGGGYNEDFSHEANVILSGTNGNATLDTDSGLLTSQTFTFPNNSGTIALMGGSDTQVLYNSGGTLAGNANFIYSGDALTVPGLTSNGPSYLIGAVQAADGLVQFTNSSGNGRILIQNAATGQANIIADNVTGGKGFTLPDMEGTFCIMTSGSGAPATTPAALGQVYVNTATAKVYISTGTGSSADWKIMN
jgi:hypothetical protein